MKKITILIVLAMLCLNFGARSQPKSQPKGLQVGDQVPETAKLNAYRGKVLILDFWATWCSPCRAMVPKTDSLNRVFKDKVLILPVTYQSEKEAAPVLQKLHKQATNLPGIYGDSILRNLFPHITLPHYVWIDPNGKVKAVTEASVLNAENLHLAIEKSAYPAETKNDLHVPYDHSKLLFTDGNGGSGAAIRYHSMLAGYVPGLSPGLSISRFDTVSGQTFNVRNSPLVWLFRLAFRENNRFFAFSRIRNQSRDSAAMRSPGSGSIYNQWLASGAGYNYELHVPPRLATQAFSIIRADLDRLFPQYVVSVEKFRTRCLALVRTGPDSLFAAKGGLPSRITVTPFDCRLQNASLGQLMSRLEQQSLQLYRLPLVDDSGYSGKVDISFSAAMNKPDDINRGLAPFGLALVEKEAETEMLVIRDRPLKTQP